MRIRTKLILGFTFLLVPLMVIAGVAYWTFSSLAESQLVVGNYLREHTAVMEVELALNRATAAAVGHLTTANPSERARYDAEVGRVRDGLGEMRGFDWLSRGERETLDQDEVVLRKVTAAAEAIFRRPDPVTGSRGRALAADLERAARTFTADMDRLQQRSRRKIDEALVAAQRTRRRSRSIVFGAAVLFVAVGLAHAFAFSRAISRPIVRLREEARRIGEGILDLPASDIQTGDEIEELAQALNAMAQQLQESYVSLEDKLARRTRELSTVNAIATTMSRSLDLRETFESVLPHILELTGMEAGVIYELDESSGELVLRAHYGRSEEAIHRVARLRVGEGLAGHVVLENAPIVSADLSQEPRLTNRMLVEEGFRFYLGVPLRSRDQVVGVLNTMSRTQHEITPQALDLFICIGNQLGVAIENARLYAQERDRSEQLSISVLEAHHRIKNNLQAISDLLALEALQEGGGGATPHLLEATVGRIGAIALVHEFLSKDADVRVVNGAEVLNKLAAMVAAANASEGQQIAVNVQAAPLSLPSKKATSLALVANELIANALRHAFPGRSRGRVEVTLASHDRQVLLEVADDGVGLPADFDLRRDARTGLRVGQRLVERDLRGELTLDRDGGTRATVRFPL